MSEPVTTIEHFAHECRIALQDAGMVHDGVTGDRQMLYSWNHTWPREADNIIAEHIGLAIEDAKEAETGR